MGIVLRIDYNSILAFDDKLLNDKVQCQVKYKIPFVIP